MNPPAAVSVLVVDDNPGKLVAIEAALSPLQLDVVTASSGSQALARLLEQDFAAILLDVNMPDIDGFEVARLLRGRDRTAHTPILFISAISQTDDHASFGYSLGAVDYIYAPVMPHVLRAKVQVFVDLYRKTQEARLQADRVAQRTRELEASHQRLRLSERMAIIGTLSAGLGHDLGNLLLPIQMRLDAAESHELPEAIRADLAAIRHCTDYLQKLANGLRLLALDPTQRGSGSERTDLLPWWADVVPLLQTSLPRGVALESEIPADLPPVRMAKAALTQAVFNLTQNAGDAMRSRPAGVVRISAECDALPDLLRITVTDDGPGMPPEVAARCLEPYFTTKSRTISTGMGLALVRGVVQQAGGSIEMRSKVGQGTTFILRVPAAQAGATAPWSVGEDGARPRAAVAVENPRIASYIGSMLQAVGFEVDRARERPRDGALLWVTDAARDAAGPIERFLAGNPRRHVVLLGVEGSAGGSGSDGSGSGGSGGVMSFTSGGGGSTSGGGGSTRLWPAPGDGQVAAIRRVIFAAARACCGQPPDQQLTDKTPLPEINATMREMAPAAR